MTQKFFVPVRLLLDGIEAETPEEAVRKANDLLLEVFRGKHDGSGWSIDPEEAYTEEAGPELDEATRAEAIKHNEDMVRRALENTAPSREWLYDLEKENGADPA